MSTIEKLENGVKEYFPPKKTIETRKDKEFKNILICFKTGHYKKIKAIWKGDSIWCHFTKPDGLMIHVNKEEIEYMEELTTNN